MIVQAAEYIQESMDEYGESSLMYGANWQGGQDPSPGNTYRTTTTLRSPESSSNYVFTGDQLTMDTGSIFAWKTSGTVTVSNLVFNGGNLEHWANGAARLYGGITVNAGRSFVIRMQENNERWFDIYAPISGHGDIEIQLS